MIKNKLLTYAVLVMMGILLIAAIRGCQKAKQAINAHEKAVAFGDSIKAAFNVYKIISDSSKKVFNDSLEFQREQNSLLEAQKQRTEADFDKILKQNKELLAQHRLAQYVDTSAVVVPNGFVTECNDCFSKLEITTNVSLKYKSDYNKLQENWDRQEKLYQNRFKEIEVERIGFNNKISTLAKQQQDAIDKLKPHGRLYLSWGVLWSPWPRYAGAGLMYQNNRNMIIGGMWYYGDKGHMVQTTINFPLSLKFR